MKKVFVVRLTDEERLELESSISVRMKPASIWSAQRAWRAKVGGDRRQQLPGLPVLLVAPRLRRCFVVFLLGVSFLNCRLCLLAGSIKLVGRIEVRHQANY